MSTKVTMRQFETLMAVAECGGFAAAAQVLNISQAAVSKQISSLERNVGFAVFKRMRGSRPALTPRGKTLISGLPDLLQQVGAATAPIQRKKGRMTEVRIACGDIIADHISDHLHLLYAKTRNIALELVQVEPAVSSVTQLESDNIDIAYLTLRAPLSGRLGEQIAVIESGLYVSARHREVSEWTPGKPLPFISTSSDTFLNREFERTLRLAGIRDYQVMARIPTARGRVNLALAGIGAICVMDNVVRQYVDAGLLQALDLPKVRMYRYRFMNPKRARNPNVKLVDAFITGILT